MSAVLKEESMRPGVGRGDKPGGREGRDRTAGHPPLVLSSLVLRGKEYWRDERPPGRAPGLGGGRAAAQGARPEPVPLLSQQCGRAALSPLYSRGHKECGTRVLLPCHGAGLLFGREGTGETAGPVGSGEDRTASKEVLFMTSGTELGPCSSTQSGVLVARPWIE